MVLNSENPKRSHPYFSDPQAHVLIHMGPDRYHTLTIRYRVAPLFADGSVNSAMRT